MDRESLVAEAQKQATVASRVRRIVFNDLSPKNDSLDLFWCDHPIGCLAAARNLSSTSAIPTPSSSPRNPNSKAKGCQRPDPERLTPS